MRSQTRCILLAACLGGLPPTLAAQADAMPALQGVSAQALAAFSFEHDTPNLVGQTMRMRRIEIAPGGSIGAHSHLGRPAVLYIIEGDIVERRGETERRYAAGESYAIGGDSSHAIANSGATPAVYIEVDIVPAR